MSENQQIAIVEPTEAQARLDAEKAEAARIANQEHRENVKDDIFEALTNIDFNVTIGDTEIHILQVVMNAIVNGKIPHVSINY